MVLIERTAWVFEGQGNDVDDAECWYRTRGGYLLFWSEHDCAFWRGAFERQTVIVDISWPSYGPSRGFCKDIECVMPKSVVFTVFPHGLLLP